MDCHIKVGDKVTSKLYTGEEKIVRTVTSVERCDDCESGFLVSADNGGQCRRCGKPHGRPIDSADAGWFVKVAAV